jgi:hypothetical protein
MNYEAENYRPISLTTVSLKKWLMPLLVPVKNGPFNDEQFGFRKNRSTND